MSSRLEQKKAFTLLELLVAIAIIGILSSLAMLGYMHYKNKARVARALSDLKTIHVALEILSADTERWPGPGPVGEVVDREVWDLNAPSAGLVDTDGTFPDWDGPYMDSVPKDPWGSDYFFDPDYRIGGTNFAVIGSFGPNRIGPNVYDSDDVILTLPAPAE